MPREDLFSPTELRFSRINIVDVVQDKPSDFGRGSESYGVRERTQRQSAFLCSVRPIIGGGDDRVI